MSRQENVNIEQKVIGILIDEGKRDTTFNVIQKLTAAFAKYIAQEKIAAPEQLITLLTDGDPGKKLAIIKAYVAPKREELPALIQAQITLPDEQLAKCMRYLIAMIDVAEA